MILINWLISTILAIAVLAGLITLFTAMKVSPAFAFIGFIIVLFGTYGVLESVLKDKSK